MTSLSKNQGRMAALPGASPLLASTCPEFLMPKSTVETFEVDSMYARNPAFTPTAVPCTESAVGGSWPPRTATGHLCAALPPRLSLFETIIGAFVRLGRNERKIDRVCGCAHARCPYTWSSLDGRRNGNGTHTCRPPIARLRPS
jgi:hypothetical protein